ncbi:hypothetical protein BJX63DRAFT_217263 [Aspergillus granulosus]|uniref:HNH nuclease domain-containing protein n=1 Tax=Aspergillus granulosus TaxID=176169 RepID=A0ABR4I142_9EURO
MNSSVSLESSITTQPLAFSEATDLVVGSMMANTCWACAKRRAQACHVIPKEDYQTELWISRGLIDFPISSHENGIALCPSCREEFDDAYDMGFTFMPEDLDFFIEFEQNDQERRRQATFAGQASERRVPDANLYKQHQVERGLVSAESIGGLYRPIFLCQILGPHLQPDPSFYAPKPWHGAPLASLRRAFLVLGSGRASVIGDERLEKLWKLKKLYFQNDHATPAKAPPNNASSTPERPTEDTSDPQDADNSPSKRPHLEPGPPDTGRNAHANETICSIIGNAQEAP